MRIEQDLYAELGVEPSATANQLRSAFRARAAELHPDSATGDEARFKELTIAYDTLVDPAARRDYDRTRGIASSPRFEFLGTPRAIRFAVVGGIALLIAGTVFGLLIPLLPNDVDGDTGGRNFALGIAAVKLFVCGVVLLALAVRRRARGVRYVPGSCWLSSSTGAKRSPCA